MEDLPCRLCLETITENDFVLLEDFEKNMIETLIPVINLNISCDTKMCDKCSKMLQMSYDFKALCLANNERVKKLLILKEVFHEPNCKSCCLCGDGILEESDDKSIINWKGMVETCIPELDIYSSEGLSACERCLVYLKDAYDFVNKCLETEESIKSYTKTENIEKKIKLYDIFKNKLGVTIMTDNRIVPSQEDSCKAFTFKTAVKNASDEKERNDERYDEINNACSTENIQNNTCLHETGTQNQETENISTSTDADVCAQNTQSKEGCFNTQTAEEQSTEVISTVADTENIQSESVVETDADHQNIDSTSTPMDVDGHTEDLPSNTCLPESNGHEGIIAETSASNCIDAVSDIIDKDGTQEDPQLDTALRDHFLPLDPSLVGQSATGQEDALHRSDGTPGEIQADSTVMEHSDTVEEALTNEGESCSTEGTSQQMNAENSDQYSDDPGTDENDLDSIQKPRKKRQKRQKVFQCDKCSYSARYRSALVSHWMSHKDATETTMFKCHECGHETKRKGDLRAHMIIHKNPEELKMFKCDLCPYKSKRKGDLKQHSAVHQNQTFKCKLCPFSTNNELYLNTLHMLTHKDKSEIKTYKCDQCPYEAKIKRHLIIHSSLHKGKAEVPMFKCNWCDFETRYKMGLKNHMIVHTCPSELTLFRCYQCEYTAKRKSDIRNHIFRHNKYRNESYQCDICPFETKDKRYLQKHKMLHLDLSEVPIFKCDLCPYQSRRKAYLRGHMLARHKKTKGVTPPDNPRQAPQGQVQAADQVQPVQNPDQVQGGSQEPDDGPHVSVEADSLPALPVRVNGEAQVGLQESHLQAQVPPPVIPMSLQEQSQEVPPEAQDAVSPGSLENAEGQV